MGTNLLHYRGWTGQFRGPHWAVLSIARVALSQVVRRKLFWVLYAFGLLFFFMFFFGQYLLAWTESQMDEQIVTVAFFRTNPADFVRILRTSLRIDGSGEMYRNFFRFQGSMVVVILAMAGTILVGNDFQFGSVPFYLAKPLSPWHYLFGKCLAVAVIINLMTTLPAVVLYVQYGMLTSWDYFYHDFKLLLGILGYGLELTVCLSLMLVATAGWLRRTVPVIMAWTTVFIFFRFLAAALVNGLQMSPRWRLIDLWNDTYLIGNAWLGVAADRIWPPRQPAVAEAEIVLGVVCLLCLIYLTLRIRAVEIVR
jgi:ABC-type transport system involved in multi-copper enzyme maturation permease subunit